MIRLSKRIRIAVLASAGLVSVGTGAGTVAAVAAASSPATGAVVPATMTAALKVQPSQAAPRTTTVKAATPAAKTAKTGKTGTPASTTAKTQPATPKSPQQVATSMLRGYGWTRAQFSFLDQLWHKESNWNANAVNPGSGAYGIAQALPASQMSSAGSDWHSNAATQIKWGLNYIKDRYGSPQAAWAHETTQGWY